MNLIEEIDDFLKKIKEGREVKGLARNK